MIDLQRSQARHVAEHEVTEEYRVTSEQLKASFPLARVNAHESTMRRTLNNDSGLGRVAGNQNCSPNRTFLHSLLNIKLEGSWKFNLWMDKTKVLANLLGLHELLALGCPYLDKNTFFPIFEHKDTFNVLKLHLVTAYDG